MAFDQILSAPNGAGKYDYFHPWDADQFTFYRVPKRLFTDENLRPMSYGAKLLYGLLLDRVSLSTRNEWIDADGRVYIIYPLQEIMENLGVSDKPVTRLMNELEQHGLIERKVQGLGRPAILYLKNFATGGDVRLQTRRISDSGIGQSPRQDSENLRTNNTNTNNTERSDAAKYAPGDDLVIDPDYRIPITPWHEAAGDRATHMELQNESEGRRYG